MNIQYNLLSKKYGSRCYHYDFDTNKIVKSSAVEAKPPYHVGLILDSPIYNSPINGMTYKVLSLSNAMTKIGHSYTFFICNRNFTSIAELDNFKIEGIKTHILDEHLFYDTSYMSELLIQEKVDVLQYETAQVFLKLGIHIKAKTFIPSTLVLHDVEASLLTQLNRNKDEVEELDYIHYITSHLADSVVTLTKLDQEKRILNHNIPREKVCVTPIGVDADILYPDPTFKDKTIGFIGNQYYEPNRRAVTFLIEEVLPLVLSLAPDATLKIIGSTPDDLIKMYEGRGEIIFTGIIQDNAQYAAELASLFVGTCCIDVGTGMNVKISNYCAAKLPVVLTPIAAKGYEEITSLNTTEFDKKKISQQIVHFLNNKDYARQKGLENHRQILKHLSWEKIAKSMESALKYAMYNAPNEKADIVSVSASKVLDAMTIVKSDRLLKGHHVVFRAISECVL